MIQDVQPDEPVIGDMFAQNESDGEVFVSCDKVSADHLAENQSMDEWDDVLDGAHGALRRGLV